ncbi:hypothetical protein BU14_0023s0001 [Porphyra umbilicalis]|uniref:Uncharacterized protein n=1 Tax=Porphyra umbilicalis TaxID=2786 RepID=A0A1X6PKA6_PORUM|nr:hypothetical protein BU14_0023s0001 [Porphyra umbilicalis]|eukprot:OSX81196.1 hypothetical protein BU14_0023s0001 [Porphyra umbilicalis]
MLGGFGRGDAGVRHQPLDPCCTVSGFCDWWVRADAAHTVTDEALAALADAGGHLGCPSWRQALSETCPGWQRVGEMSGREKKAGQRGRRAGRV